MDRQKYDKGGSAGSKGVQFQVNLLTIFLLNALKKLTDWRLSTEDKRLGKFDDVALEWREGAVLLQAKHRENRTRITVEALMSTNSKKSDFSLPKYFFSYQEVKDKFTLKNVIVCTNADVNEKALEFLETRKDSYDSMLHCEDDNSFHTFNIESTESMSLLKQKVHIYYHQNNIKDSGIDESVVTNENLKDFLEHLQLYFNYPSQNVAENNIKQLLRKSSWHNEVSPSEVYNKVMDWYRQKTGEYLDEPIAKAMFSEIKRDKHWQSLDRYNVFFENNNFNFHDSKRIYHFIADNSCLLQELRMYHALNGMEKKVLCIYPDNSIEDQKQLIDAFGLRGYTYLIIVWPKLQEDSEIKTICKKIKEILDKHAYKKIILLTQSNNKLFEQIKLKIRNSIEVTIAPPKFGDLSKETQDRLLDEKEIIFQGKSINLNKLFFSETFKDYDTVLSSEILEKLVRNKKIEVGSELRLLEESISHVYIHRYFVRNDEKREEGNIFDVREKLILISDSAGSGKTTVLTKLAMVIKDRNPHLWVIRIELSHYSKILKDSLRKKERTISLLKLLNSQDATKLTNKFEQDIFSMRNKVLLLVDAIDEISPYYTNPIINLLLECQMAPNLAKILVTTRPHLTQELEEKLQPFTKTGQIELQVKSFVLQPFTKTDQIEFLTNYWTHNLKLDHTHREKCEQYAKALMNKMSSWTELFPWEESQFTTIPLQLKMLAEIFQEENKQGEALDWRGCKEFLNLNELEPELPERVDLAKLYSMFLEKKRTVFIEEKNPSEYVRVEQVLTEKFDKCLSDHRTLALKTVLTREECELFTCYDESDKDMIPYLLDIGIVNKVDNGMHFMHRTFAEYFVAECLLRELQCQNQNAEFQKFLIDGILHESKYKIILNFFDSLLKNYGVDKIPRNIFQNYQSLSYKIDVFYMCSSSSVHYLAEQGCVATLQLLLKCINFEAIKDKEVSFYELDKYIKDNDKIFQGHFLGNTLDILQFFVKRGGVNIKDHGYSTPLHLAAGKGHLEMVKFLLEQSSNVTNVKILSLTALCKAASGGHLRVVKFLVEQGTDVKEHIRQGGNALYTAICRDYVNIVTYLLDRVFEEEGLQCGLDPEYSMIPFASAYLGRLNILEILVERGLDVNCKIKNEQSLIFGAAIGGQSETIKYLIQKGADINKKSLRNNTVLHTISNKSHLLYIAQLLVELGIDVDVKNNLGRTALYYAAKAGMLDVTELLIKCGADVNSKDIFGSSILRVAASKDHLKVVELLAKHDADINAKNIRDDTLLHLFAERGRLDAVKCLAKFDVDFTIKNCDGQTPLHIALLNGKLDVAKFLIECNSDVNSRDNLGQTALHLAVSMNIISIKTRFFLMCRNIRERLRLDEDNANDDMHMLTHLDVSKHLGIIQCLVDHGANINARNNAGQTVLHLAVLYFQKHFNFYVSCGQCFSVVKFLIKQGAEINIDSSLEDSLVTLAKEIKECDPYYSRKKLKEIFNLPLFRLLLGQTLLSTNVNKIRKKGIRRTSFPTSKINHFILERFRNDQP